MEYDSFDESMIPVKEERMINRSKKVAG